MTSNHSVVIRNTLVELAGIARYNVACTCMYMYVCIIIHALHICVFLCIFVQFLQAFEPF